MIYFKYAYERKEILGIIEKNTLNIKNKTLINWKLNIKNRRKKSNIKNR